MSSLIVVDVQNDFCEGGSLQVNNASEIIPIINQLKRSPKFSSIYLSQDWHPANHISFQVNNPESALFGEKLIEQTGILQVMWPVHCVQNTTGSDFNPNLEVSITDHLIKKGLNPLYDSYSAFGCPQDRTNLNADLSSNNTQKVYVCGLALDYCVGNTALDASTNGFETYVIIDATRGVAQNTSDSMLLKLTENNVKLINSTEILTN